VLAPTLTATPAIDQAGRLRIVGFFPTRPLQINFDLLFRTHPVKAADAVVDGATGDVIGDDYAAARCGPARFQFQGNSSSMRLAG
jgi:hypothetical protein